MWPTWKPTTDGSGRSGRTYSTVCSAWTNGRGSAQSALNHQSRPWTLPPEEKSSCASGLAPMAIGRHRLALRLGRARPVAPTGIRRPFARRPGGIRPGSMMRVAPGGMYVLRGRRGGFFKSLVKTVRGVVKTITKVPVLGAVAKAAVGSLPIVGQVTTAVNAFKSKTPVGVAASPVGGTPPTSGNAHATAQSVNARANRRPRRRKSRMERSKKYKAEVRRRKKRTGKGGVSAKQRAARARFARAAKKGRIRKGQRL